MITFKPFFQYKKTCFSFFNSVMADKAKDPEHKRILAAYTDLLVPGALAGINRFYQEYKKTYPDSKVTRTQVKKAIETLPIYQLHVGRRQRFQRRRYKLPPGSLSEFETRLFV